MKHPFKAGAPDALKAQLPTWVWPLGDGLLPIPLVGTYAAPGSGAWELDAPLLARLRQVDPKASESWGFWVFYPYNRSPVVGLALRIAFQLGMLLAAYNAEVLLVELRRR